MMIIREVKLVLVPGYACCKLLKSSGMVTHQRVSAINSRSTIRVLLFNILIVASCLLAVDVARAGGKKNEPRLKTGLMFNEAADGLSAFVPFKKPFDQSASKEKILEGYREFIEYLAGTQVTHLLLNVNYQRACFPSQAWDSYWDVDDPEKNVTTWHRSMWQIFRKGVDPYSVCIDLCREKKISPWASMRMNDTHYINDPHKANSFWQQHPEYRSAPKSGLNYALPEVREHHLSLIREIFERYDIDGLELDWVRFCHHFKPNEQEANCNILTQFMADVRQIADKAALKRGHPIQIAARVPAVPRFARGFGLDGSTWVQKKLVDILIVSSIWMPADRDTPIEQWRKLIGPVEHEYSLTASMGLWVKCAPGRVCMRNNLESARGFAANMLHRGADQIYLFNHFNYSDFNYPKTLPDGSKQVTNILRQILNESASLETVVNKPRRHILTYHDTAPPHKKNLKPLPAILKTNGTASFRIYIGPKAVSGKAILRVGLDESKGLWKSRFELKVNNMICSQIENLNEPGQYKPHNGKGFHYAWKVAQVAPRVAQFEVPLSAIRDGYNDIEISLKTADIQTISWLELYLVP